MLLESAEWLSVVNEALSATVGIRSNLEVI